MRSILGSMVVSSLALAQVDGGAAKVEAKPVAAPTAKVVQSIEGFSTPESVLYDAETDTYLVSNINGSPVAKDNNGFISEVSADGKILTLKFIEGGQKKVTLNAPKGMALSKGSLYVADIDTVRWFDRKTGAPQGSLPILGSTFVNDLTVAADGTIYLSDSGLKGTKDGLGPTGTDGVYAIETGKKPKLRTVKKSKDLHGPNGVLAIDGTVLVVPFGGDELFTLDGKGKDAAAPVHTGAKGLDGLIKVGNELIFSSWDSKALWHGPAAGPFVQLLGDLEAPADIGFDSKRNRVLVPRFMKNQVDVVQLP